MKRFILSSTLIFFCLFASAQVTLITDSFLVRGNCEQCKDRIEHAAKKVKGVRSAEWSEKNEQIVVTYDSSLTKLLAIHEKIAGSGHDTKLVRAKKSTYNSLPGCCMYKRDPEGGGIALIETVVLQVSGKICNEQCASELQGYIYKLKGVKSCEMNSETLYFTITFTNDKLKKEELIKAIESFRIGKNDKENFMVEKVK